MMNRLYNKSIFFLILFFSTIIFANEALEKEEELLCGTTIKAVEDIIDQEELLGFPDLNTYLMDTFWLGETGGYPFQLGNNKKGHLRISLYMAAKGKRLGNPFNSKIKVCPTGDGTLLVKAAFNQKINISILIPQKIESERLVDEDGSENVEGDKEIVVSTKNIEPMRLGLEGIISGIYELVIGVTEEEKEQLSKLFTGNHLERAEFRKEFVKNNDFYF